MKQNINIEAEGQELVLKNKAGDYVIIPKKYRTEVQGMIKDGCHGCIDSLVETLPVMTDYAQDGSLYSEYLTNNPPVKKHFLDPNLDGSLPSYFKGSEENPILLDEVTVTSEAPEWVKYRREYVKNNPFNIDEYVENRFNNPVGREAIKKIDQEGWRKELRQKGLEKRYNSAMDYVSEQLVKNKPQGELTRAEWLNQMSDKEEEIIKRNPKYQSSLWADTKRGLISLVEKNPLQTFQNILNSSDYTDREKREMLQDYIDHPIMSQLGDAAKVLNPLSIPSKMVQSAYKDDYSFTDALKGKKNNAGIVEDIVTDPLNLVGAGLVGKLSKADKVIDATKVGSKVLNKTDDVGKNLPKFKSEIDWSKWNKEIPNNKPLMQEYNAIEKTTKANGTWMKNPDGSDFDGTPEQFIQQLSTNFQKAFPNPILDDVGNIQINYHGSPNKFEEFKPALKPTDKTGERLGKGIYTTHKRTKALEYATKNQNKKGNLYELYQNANNKQTAIQDIDNYITTKIEKIKSDFLNKKISNQKANELYDAVLKENDELWDKIPDSEFKLQEGKDFLRIDDEQIVPFTNYPKSAIGNNGMFDMTNPNIYKGIIPPALLFYLQSKNKIKLNNNEL